MYSVKAATELEVYPEGTGKPMMDFKQRKNVVKDLNLGKIMLDNRLNKLDQRQEDTVVKQT